MRLLSCDCKIIVSGLAFGLFLFGLTSCAPTPHPDASPGYDVVDSNIDPESAAMEAFARAHLLSIDGDFEGSLEAIEQAIEIDPDSAFLYMSRPRFISI